jgi:hypothetical protein
VPLPLAFRPNPPERLADFWPTYLALAVTLVAATLLPPLLNRLWRRLRQRRAYAAGLCANCGYSTQGLPTAICPECGKDINQLGQSPAARLARWVARAGPVLAVLLWSAGLIAFANHKRTNASLGRWLDQNATFLNHISSQEQRTLVIAGPRDPAAPETEQNRQPFSVSVTPGASGEDAETTGNPELLAVVIRKSGPAIRPISSVVVYDRPKAVRGQRIPVPNSTALEITFPSTRWTATTPAGETFGGDKFDDAAARLWAARCKSFRVPNRVAQELQNLLSYEFQRSAGETAKRRARYLVLINDAPTSKIFSPYPRITNRSTRIAIWLTLWLLGLAALLLITRRRARRTKSPTFPVTTAARAL